MGAHHLTSDSPVLIGKAARSLYETGQLFSSRPELIRRDLELSVGPVLFAK
jgi:hypothetical protein